MFFFSRRGLHEPPCPHAPRHRAQSWYTPDRALLRDAACPPCATQRRQMFTFNFDTERCVPQPAPTAAAPSPHTRDDDKLDAFLHTDDCTTPASAFGATDLPRDVVRGEYEGGAQVWECTSDLLAALPSLPLRAARVLDLGCGAGLLGAAALRAGAARVVFSDLNRDVLERVTARTVSESRSSADVSVAGASGDARADAALFIAGSWDALLAVARGDASRCGGRDCSVAAATLRERFDVILSAETAYRPENCAKLAALCDALLASPGGVAYFATKRFYFGSELCGGTDALCAAVARYTPGLTAQRFAEYTDNVVRDIIQISRGASSS